MYRVRDIIIKKDGLINGRVIRTIHGEENVNGFITPKRGDMITIVGNDGYTYVLIVKYIHYDYDTYWHNRDGAIEITIHCR